MMKLKDIETATELIMVQLDELLQHVKTRGIMNHELANTLLAMAAMLYVIANRAERDKEHAAEYAKKIKSAREGMEALEKRLAKMNDNTKQETIH